MSPCEFTIRIITSLQVKIPLNLHRLFTFSHILGVCIIMSYFYYGSRWCWTEMVKLNI